LYQTVGSW